MTARHRSDRHADFILRRSGISAETPTRRGETAA
jgi:hypothetical protein